MTREAMMSKAKTAIKYRITEECFDWRTGRVVRKVRARNLTYAEAQNLLKFYQDEDPFYQPQIEPAVANE
jgi:hypothetical protein